MPSEKELAVAKFYDGIYLFYETVNSLLTIGLDRRWRAAAAALAARQVPGAASALDACCGTGDFSLALAKAFNGRLTITGTDLSEAMLSAARTKLPEINFVKAEAKELPFPDASFDLITISFATRNLDLDHAAMLAALKEFRRVLKPGGLFLNLETTRPANPALWFFMRAYVKASIGLLNLLSPASRSSYSFLKNTILDFYTAEEFSALLGEAGFASPSAEIMFPGAVAAHTAFKPPPPPSKTAAIAQPPVFI